MQIFQNRSKRIRMLISSLFLSILMSVIDLFILSALVGLVNLNNTMESQRWILIIPFCFFLIMSIVSFISLRIHLNYLNVTEPLLTITDEGITVLGLKSKQLFTPWEQIKEIRYNRFNRTKLIRIKGKDKSIIGTIPVKMLNENVNVILSEIEKYKPINSF
ncbi:PH domain-containing protein [Shimazuella sp. AN120528]|uniref:PH domain-containing protein n=1 Tax=Shimazuella soli TaxID=1892854 RepID=UPI001F0FEA22|nr:PH domain-containing protein [Shimazuella soli]MCH5584097.1 PH domain-containing protein [Shimazuella soli]